MAKYKHAVGVNWHVDRKEKDDNFGHDYFFIVFLKIIGFVFKAGFRILGWLFSGLGFIISVILAVTAADILFDALPIILILGILLIARRPA